MGSRLDHLANLSVLYTIVPGYFYKKNKVNICSMLKLHYRWFTSLILFSMSSILDIPVRTPCNKNTGLIDKVVVKNKVKMINIISLTAILFDIFGFVEFKKSIGITNLN